MTTTKHKKTEHKKEKGSLEKVVPGQWNTLIVIVLAIALFLAFFQAVQISSVSATIATHEEQIVSFAENGITAQASTQTTSTGSSGVPASLQNIPDMVGGC